MTLSLRARLFAGTLLAIAASLVLVMVLAARVERDWVESRARERLERAAERAATVLARTPPARRSAVANQLKTLLGFRCTLIDSSGRVIADSDVRPERLPFVENHAGRPEVRAALTGVHGSSRRHSATVGRDLLYVAVPAPARGLAVVRLAEPLAEVGRLRSSLLTLLALVAVFAFLVTGAVVYVAAGRHASRIADLEHVASGIGMGEEAPRARELPADEVGRLGAAINRMAGELRERLATLERERDQQQLILSRMSDGVALLDRDDRVVRANPSLAEILDLVRPPEPGTPFPHVARSPELADALAAARSERRTIERDVRLWAPRERLVRATVTPLAGEPLDAVVLVLRDLSEIERAQRVRQDFVANVSHELRTPLTSLRGYAETLLEGGLDDVERREGFVRVIRDQAGRLQELVEDLLSLAELERPDARLRVERFDLRALAADQVAAFQEHVGRTGLTLELVDGPPIEVTADRRRLEQVLANLLDNAVKYTERGGVTVTLGADGPRAWGEVRDTGPGIPAGEQDRVFERFYRVDKARSREKGGTGLGLSIVKHIVALHDGTISLESQPGHGSTFRFEIPRSPNEGST